MTTFYRGFQVPAKDLDDKYTHGSLISLQGFASTTCLRDRGIGFAVNGLTEKEEPDKNPILLEINFTG